MKRFAERLKILRKEHGFRQKDLAEKLGYARTTIANYEQALRFPPLDTLFEIADFFQVSLDYLLGRTNIRLSPEKIVYDRVRVPILVIDPHSGKIFDCNDNAVDFYGYEKDILTQMDIYSVNILSKEEINEKMSQAVGKHKGTFRFKHRLADGSIKDVQVFSGPLLIDNKKYLYSVIYDLTDSSESKKFPAIEQQITPLARVFNYRFPYKNNHHKKVASISVIIGKSLKLNSESINLLNIAGKIHDIGLLLIPAEITNNFNYLGNNEMEIYKKHTTYGAELTANIDGKLSTVIKQHHEYINGSGYPNGLSGDDIVPEAKILAVADIIDILSTDQTYTSLSGKSRIISYLEKYKGLRYDSSITEKANELLKKDMIYI